jgi:hypothetical protein
MDIMRVRYFRYLFGTALTAIVGINGYSTNSKAVQLRDGTFYFNQPPRLVEAATTYTALPAAMRYILKAESYDRIGIRKKNYIT